MVQRAQRLGSLSMDLLHVGRGLASRGKRTGFTFEDTLSPRTCVQRRYDGPTHFFQPRRLEGNESQGLQDQIMAGNR